MAISKGEKIIAGGTTGSAGYQIHHFETREAYMAAKEAGSLDDDKYYSFPELSTANNETTMKVQYSDGTTKEYIIYCKEV